MENDELLEERREFDAMIAEWGETSIRALLIELSRLDKPYACKLLSDYDLETISLHELFGFENSTHNRGNYGLSIEKEAEGRAMVEFGYYSRDVGDGGTFVFSYSDAGKWVLIESNQIWMA